MKKRTLKAENITKAFRKFTGGLCIQIDGGQWIELQNTPEVEELTRARSMGKLSSVTIDENKKIVEIKIGTSKKEEDPVMKKLRESYRHG